MTMSIARLSAQSGLKYLFKTTMMDDLAASPPDATTYYMQIGTPQGRWIGSGLAGINRNFGDVVTESDAKAIFDRAVHPDFETPLGKPHGQPTIAQTKAGKPTTRHAVVGFDLTFSVPKSVSVLWALSPSSVQEQILETHHDAVNATLKWLEEHVIHTRAGRNGVARIGTRGAVAAAFDHWESRSGDPQLHTHLVIANRVKRVTDGVWVTLDSRTLYKAAVAASEHYNGLLFDAVHMKFGTDTNIIETGASSHNPSQQLAGIDSALIREFSNRSRLIDIETDRLVGEWSKELGHPPTATTIIKLRQQATLSTRVPKTDQPMPLHELSSKWRVRAIAKGFDPKLVLAATIRRSHLTPFASSDFSESWITAVASITREQVAAKRATWNRWNLLAEAERVCAQIRCRAPEGRNVLIEQVAIAAEQQSVPLNEYRYTLPPDAQLDLRLGHRSVFDFHGSRLFTDAKTLASEEVIMAARNDDGGPVVRATVTMDALKGFRQHGGFELHGDQRAASAEVVLSGNRLDAIVGPAGTGKTTTLGAVRAVWEAEYGAGSVIGLAPAAASAEVLGRELAMATENVAKWLYESVGQGANGRAERFLDLDTRLAAIGTSAGRHVFRYKQEATRLAAEQQRWTFRQNQLVIVDEASMVSTFQLSALIHQAKEAGAKILLVGDPAQLDAIDAGGVLGWLDRKGKTTRLRTIWRFEEEWEREASLKLRYGDYTAIEDYERHRRLRHGTYLDVVDQAYRAWQSDTQAGKSSILIAADNDTVNMLNERAQADLVVQGLVDAEETVPLSDGLHAGRGDTVIARRNDRKMLDSNGDFLRNGCLLDVGSLSRRDGSLVAIRCDTGATITLHRDYLESSVELGYATTAHRSQGITVDTGHAVVTQGRLTRELLYVSMTRGRCGNHAYVSEGDSSEHQPLDPALQPSWRRILGEILAAEGAERAAHEIQELERSKADSLERLNAEYDHLAQIVASDDLSLVLELHCAGLVDEMRQSPSWGPAVAAWRRSASFNRASAERTVVRALECSSPTIDNAAILHTRLRQLPARTATGEFEPLSEHLRTTRPDLADLLAQIKARMEKRMDDVAWNAMLLDSDWKRALLEAIGPLESEVASELVRRVAIFRDRWGISESPLLLGPIPADYEWEQREQRTTLQAEIERVKLQSIPPTSELGSTYPCISQPAALIGAGWQL